MRGATKRRMGMGMTRDPIQMLSVLPAKGEAATHARKSNPTLLVKEAGVKLYAEFDSLAVSFEGEDLPLNPGHSDGAKNPPVPYAHLLSIPAAKQLSDDLQKLVEEYLNSGR